MQASETNVSVLMKELSIYGFVCFNVLRGLDEEIVFAVSCLGIHLMNVGHPRTVIEFIPHIRVKRAFGFNESLNLDVWTTAQDNVNSYLMKFITNQGIAIAAYIWEVGLYFNN